MSWETNQGQISSQEVLKQNRELATNTGVEEESH